MAPVPLTFSGADSTQFTRSGNGSSCDSKLLPVMVLPSGHWLDKTARIHLVVDSPEGAYTVIGPSKQVWRSGDVVLGQYSIPHSVYNPHPTRNRTHLVVDVAVGNGERSPSRKRLKRLFGAGIESLRIDRKARAATLKALNDFQCTFRTNAEEYASQLDQAQRAWRAAGGAGSDGNHDDYPPRAGGPERE